MTTQAAAYDWTLDELRAIHLALKRATDPEIELVAGLADPFALAA